jgi:hypothetical protein
MVVVCISPFEKLAKRGENQLQENISKRLHDHFFSSIIFYFLSNSHQVHLRSCVGLGAGAWFAS